MSDSAKSIPEANHQSNKTEENNKNISPFLSSNSSCTKISALKNVQMEEAIFYCGDAVCHKVCNVLNMADAKKLPPITRKKRRGKESGRQGY